MSNLAFMAPMASFGANLTGAVDRRNMQNMMIKRQDEERKQQHELQQRSQDRADEQLKLLKQKAFFDESMKTLELTPDEQLPAWTEHYNSLAPQYGTPQLSGIRRVDKQKKIYDVKDIGGKAWIFNANDGTLKEAAGAEGTQISTEKPSASRGTVRSAPSTFPNWKVGKFGGKPMRFNQATGQYEWIPMPGSAEQDALAPSTPDAQPGQPGPQQPPIQPQQPAQAEEPQYKIIKTGKDQTTGRKVILFQDQYGKQVLKYAD